MFPTNERRLKELRYIRLRAIGASARAAAAHAGWHPNSSHLIERRLKAEVELRKAQLRGMNGAATWTISKRDIHRVLWNELGRLADRFGPNQKAIEEQTLRALARQVKLSDAREHHKRIDSKLHREVKATGAPSGRTLKMRDLCRALIVEIGKFRGSGSGEAGATPEAHEQQPPPAVAADRCPAHPSQPRNRCAWCAFTQVEPALPDRWGAERWGAEW